MANAGMGARERAVEDGLDALGDAELVALVLGTGRAGEPVAVLAASLLEESGGVGGLARAGLGELAARRGLGVAKGARLAAAVELGRRVATAASRQADARFPSSAAVDGWARPRLASLDHEELWALVLDGHQGLRAARRVASGGLHGLHVGARDPLRVALRDGGSAFVLVHNHPSGDPAASKEDVRFTEEVARAADVVGVPLLDHVIVARGGYASLLDQGRI
jgi:DNA repair protein RadC